MWVGEGWRCGCRRGGGVGVGGVDEWWRRGLGVGGGGMEVWV